MNKINYKIVFVALFIAQILINNFWHVSQYLLLSFMPLLLLSLPLKHSNVMVLFIAFFVGLAVDLLSSSTLGITSCALLLCAICKNLILKMVYGEELFTYREGSPLNFHTTRELLLSLTLFCAIYFIPYVFIESSGSRPFSFIFLRWLCSFAFSSGVNCILATFLFKAD